MRVATVANFPEGSDDILAVADEAAAAAAAGADEVDVVAPIAAILDGDVGIVGELVEACRAAIGPGKTLKLILETGVLQQQQLISAAGPRRGHGRRRFPEDLDRQGPVGRHLGSLCRAAGRLCRGRWPGRLQGCRRHPHDSRCRGYLQLADDLIGPGWASPRRFRFGASGLLDDLLRSSGRDEAGGSASGY